MPGTIDWTARFTINVGPLTESSEREGMNRAKDLFREGLRVWIAEDETLYRNTLARALSQVPGLCCEHAFGSCEEILKSLNSESPPDVVLMDIVLSGMDGIEGAGRIRAIAPSVDTMILTNYADDDKVFRALCAGATGYLLKTAPPQEIRAAIREVAEGGVHMTAQIARKVLGMFARLTVPHGDYSLTEREREILRLGVDGLTKKKIAETLALSYLTVDTHLKNIYSKLHVHTRSGAVAKALKEHLV